MFKSILTALILALISVNLIASENKNALTISGGLSTKIKETDNPELNPKTNIGINYLRSINDSFALGIDLQAQLGSEKQYLEKNYDTGEIAIFDVKNNTNLIAMILTDIKLLQTNQFNLATQIGVGVAIHKVKVEINTYSNGINNIPDNTVIINSTEESTLAIKFGLVGQYEINDNFALGLGVHYFYMGETNFEILGITIPEATIKNDSIVTTNINLTYKF